MEAYGWHTVSFGCLRRPMEAIRRATEASKGGLRASPGGLLALFNSYIRSAGTVFGIRHAASSIRYLVSGIQYLVSGISTMRDPASLGLAGMLGIDSPASGGRCPASGEPRALPGGRDSGRHLSSTRCVRLYCHAKVAGAGN